MSDEMTLARPNRKQRLRRNFWAVILSGVVRLLLRVDCQGLERLPSSGPVILYFNHIHYSDPFIIISLLRKRRYAVPIAKRELAAGPLIGKMVTGFGAIFVDRGEVDMAALRAALAVLEEGHVLMISPEGTRSRATHALMAAKRGLGLLTRHTQPVLMPVAIWGTTDFPSAYTKGRRPTAYIRFGQPYRLEIPADVSRKEAEAAVTEYAMQELAALLPAPMRGVYAPPAQPHPWVRPLPKR